VPHGLSAPAMPQTGRGMEKRFMPITVAPVEGRPQHQAAARSKARKTRPADPPLQPGKVVRSAPLAGGALPEGRGSV